MIVQGGQSQTSAKKAGQKAKGSGTSGLHVQIKDEWVTEHASQVAPLVPGGMLLICFVIVTCHTLQCMSKGAVNACFHDDYQGTSSCVSVQVLQWWDYTSLVLMQPLLPATPSFAEPC